MYSSVISKPKMTESMLARPPFLFLHDTVTALMVATNFPKGLFTADECKSFSIWNKKSKIVFLQKLIDHVSSTLGISINCNPSRVVAGQEPEKTNIFLQSLFAAATGQYEKKTKNG